MQQNKMTKKEYTTPRLYAIDLDGEVLLQTGSIEPTPEEQARNMIFENEDYDY